MIRKLMFAGAAVLTVVFGLASAADAQWNRVDRAAMAVAAREADPGPEGWGTSAATVVTYFAQDFHMVEGVETWDGTTGSRLCVQAPCYWLAGVNLPNGAQIVSVEGSACDGDAAGQVAIALGRGPRIPGPVVFLVPYTGTGGPETPGCTSFLVNLPTPPTVDNNAYTYGLAVYADPGATIQWNSLRVRYRLQVSPAPATATFTDVPVGSSLHRFVEALAASGITGGCGGGNYCPDGPLTRGQMAVFLAVALGLHFPN